MILAGIVRPVPEVSIMTIEFIGMIQAQRGYEANSKVVTAADNMYQQVNNLQR